MVEDPMERYPRFFATFIILMLVVAWVSLRLTKWFALSASTADPYVTAVFGWAMGGLAVLVLTAIARRLDRHEELVARVNQALGGA